MPFRRAFIYIRSSSFTSEACHTTATMCDHPSVQLLNVFSSFQVSPAAVRGPKWRRFAAQPCVTARIMASKSMILIIFYRFSSENERLWA